MTILVTGAPGWLGTRLVRRLTERGHTARCLVYEKDWPLERAHSLLPDTDIIAGDIRDPASVDAAMQGIECVMHLAGARHSLRTEALRAVNVEGTRIVADAAARHGVRHFIHASSISVFGNNTSHSKPLTESSRPSPRTAYGRTKLWSESALRLVCGDALPTTILRPGPFYGPGQSASFRLLSTLVRRGMAPRMLGQQARQSLAHVDNVVEAFIAAYLTPATSHRTLLIADERPYTMMELMTTIAAVQGTSLRSLPLPRIAIRTSERIACMADRTLGFHIGLLTMAGEFGRERWCEIDEARHTIGYTPRLALVDGIRDAWIEEIQQS